jgi:hypothetical protein
VLANQPHLLERTWASGKQVMVEPGLLDPGLLDSAYKRAGLHSGIDGQQLQLLRPFSHGRGVAWRLSDQQYAEFLAVIGMAAETNTLANSPQIPVDREFLIA